MEHSLMKEVSQKTVDAYLNTRKYPGRLFQIFFPFKSHPFLTYETIIGSNGHPVAADVVAYNVSAPKKSRRIIDKLRGDIPAIKISRTMDEKEILDYDTLRSQINWMATEGGKKQRQDEILQLIYDDVDFVIKGVHARLEWLALQAISTGQIALSTSTNNGLVTQEVIDFQMPDANKRVIESATATRVWNNGTVGNYLPITDIEDLKDAAEDEGYSIQYVLMDLTKWQQMRMATEVIQYVGDSTLKVRKPLLSQVNETLKSDGLPTIILIDSRVRLETKNHTFTTVRPWTTKYVTAIPELKLGNTLAAPIADEMRPPKQAIISKKDNVLIEKYSDINPITEHTIGICNAFPSWESVNSCFRLDTEGTPQADGLDD